MTEITQADRDFEFLEYFFKSRGLVFYKGDGQSWLTLKDAIAHFRAQAREEALREAAGVCASKGAGWVDEYWPGQFGDVRSALEDARDTILALIEARTAKTEEM